MLDNGKLESLTGESRRTIQFWVDGSVLRPDPSSLNRGPGKPKIYPDTEAKWALLASRFSAMGLALTELRNAINTMRASFEPAHAEPASPLGLVEHWENEKTLWQKALTGTDVVWLAYGKVHLYPVYDMPSRTLEPRLGPPHYPRLRLSQNLHTLEQWAKNFAWPGVEDPTQRMDGFLAFDLTELFAPLHHIYRPDPQIINVINRLRKDPTSQQNLSSLDVFDAMLWLARNRSESSSERCWALDILTKTKAKKPDEFASIIGSFLSDPDINIVILSLHALGECSSGLVGDFLRAHLEDDRRLPNIKPGDNEIFICELAMKALAAWDTKRSSIS